MDTNERSGVRRGEIIAAMSLATDLAMGQPAEFAMQSCILATRIGRTIGLAPEELAEVFYQSLLRYIGCNAETHVLVALFGDEIGFRRDFARVDNGRANEVMSLVFSYLRRANTDAGFFESVAAIMRGLLTSKRKSAESIAGHCEVAERLAERLALPENVRRNLGQIYERWDGRGLPKGLKGEAIAPPVRVVSFAQDAIVLRRAFGLEATMDKLRKRRGTAYEPTLVDEFVKRSEDLTRGLDDSTWSAVLALEPQPHADMTEAEFDAACLAMADFADLKSPYSVGHSRAVAALAAGAARYCRLPAAAVAELRRAALLHDIGQVAISARIWLKPGSFNDADWEQVRLHAYYGERVLARPPALAGLAAIIGQHHERTDGSGYHRGLRGSTLSLQGKILAAAEAYQNKIEPRPHRAASSPQAAADALKREVRQGKLDSEAVAAVLAAAGHSLPARKTSVGDLTPREIDVLREMARGRTMKEIARTLKISPKTVDNHAQSIYAKIGVKTRGGATLFAIEHGLCGP
jgi:HD-GYP domain-containing protein (c-di-GMP phosphodiesterase class II)